MDNTQLLLQEITEANGVSGYEGEIRQIMRRELDKYADKVETDKMGSIIGSKTGTNDDPRVMVIGHLDEVGFMVKEITDEGYIKFLALGGWWGHVALGQRMRIITSKGPVLGVIGSTPPHLLELKEREKVLKIKEMFIDVGCQEKFDVKTYRIVNNDDIVARVPPPGAYVHVGQLKFIDSNGIIRDYMIEREGPVYQRPDETYGQETPTPQQKKSFAGFKFA